QSSLLKEAKIEILKSRIFQLKKEDWTEKWKKFFKLQKIGKKLVIKPSWIDYIAKKDEILIEIDPGMSFGTGKHETTRFCLVEIERLRGQGEKSFLDAGTGSGILSIAASKLGYSRISAFDNDIEAVNVARENFKKNSIPPGKIELLYLKLEEAYKIKSRFDVIAANIISSELIKNSKILKALCSPSGKIILAGIPDLDAKDVINAFSEFKIVLTKSRCGWTGLTLSAI
ncbi:MAG TPA: 50S ribosomal protein L11 methyltransferase, partial [Victivallales bacterium]|nr:50S ribosomal protein L11 methyltransferase [Victivallales bacterium]